MKKIYLLLFAFMLGIGSKAQNASKPFHASIYDEENGVHMEINFYDKDIVVPDQEVFGEIAGYIASKKDFRKWLIVDVELVNNTTANLTVINDYGSEDFTAILTERPDGSYLFKHLSGSPLKFVVNKKWQKMPSNLHLKRQKE